MSHLQIYVFFIYIQNYLLLINIFHPKRNLFGKKSGVDPWLKSHHKKGIPAS